MALPEIPRLELARFRTLSGSPAVEFDVQFNPESLEYSVSNTLKEEGKGARKKQFIDRSSAKLTMKLVFDTTDSGEDVRERTDQVAALMRPVGEAGKQVPPNVEFSWGLYAFSGMVERHKETIDYFAASGVPLRATIELTLVSQDVQFDSGRNPPASVDGTSGSQASLVAAAGGAAGLAGAMGDPRSARAIAGGNGMASLRFGGEAGLFVGGEVRLQAEAGFSAGAGLGGGIGIGGGIGGGISFGVSGGASAGAAFSGLRSPAGVSASTSPGAGMTANTGVSMGGGGSVGASARFGPMGRVEPGGGGGSAADVGAGVDLGARLRFG